MNSVDDEEWDREDVQGVVEGDQAWRTNTRVDGRGNGVRLSPSLLHVARVVTRHAQDVPVAP